MPELLDQQPPVLVTEFSLVDAADIQYTTPANVVALLLRGAKRLQADLWTHWVLDARLNIADFEVTRRLSLDWSDAGWTSIEERLDDDQ